MAYFDRVRLPNNVSAKRAWTEITTAIRDGYPSVEIVQRKIDGEHIWEVRKWDGLRGTREKSNAKGASPNIDY